MAHSLSLLWGHLVHCNGFCIRIEIVITIHTRSWNEITIIIHLFNCKIILKYNPESRWNDLNQVRFPKLPTFYKIIFTFY